MRFSRVCSYKGALVLLPIILPYTVNIHSNIINRYTDMQFEVLLDKEHKFCLSWLFPYEPLSLSFFKSLLRTRRFESFNAMFNTFCSMNNHYCRPL